MAITHDTTAITLSVAETGDSLRTYMVANSLGTVAGRSMLFDRHFEVTSDLVFTDYNASYIFPSDYHLNFTTQATEFSLTDCVIIHTDQAKGHSTLPRAASLNLTRVHYRAEAPLGQTNFFSNSQSGFAFNDVSFISYSPTATMHLTTGGGLLSDVQVAGTFSSANISCPIGQELVCRNFTFPSTLGGVFAGPGGNKTSTIRLENLTWGKFSWYIYGASSQGQTFVVVNPNKPDGWIKYIGADTDKGNTYEVHTHNLKVVDENNTPLEGGNVQMRRSDGSTVVYDLTTDTDGQIPEQEVVTYDQAAGSNVWTQYSDFELRFVSYSNVIVSGVRALQDGAIDEVVTSVADLQITEPDKAIVDAYTTQETPARAYDHLKAILVDNYAGETVTYVITDLGKTVIDAGVFNIEIDGTGSGAPTVVGNTITSNATIFNGDIITTTEVTLINGAKMNGLITSNSLDSNFVPKALTGLQGFPTANDRIARTNQIFNIGVGETFNFQKGSDYYLVASTSTGTEVNINKLNIDIVVGENEISLDNTSLLLDIQATTILVKEKTDIIETKAEADLRQTLLITEIIALNNITAADVWAVASRTLTEKTGFSLDSAEYTSIANAVQSAIINEGDGQQVIDAIVQAIGNSNVDEIALVAAIRADIERNGGMIDNIPTLNEIEASSTLAKEGSVQLAIAVSV